MGESIKLEDLGISINNDLNQSVVLIDDHFDCDCKEDYINKHDEDNPAPAGIICDACGADLENAPNSRLNEYLHLKAPIEDDTIVFIGTVNGWYVWFWKKQGETKPWFISIDDDGDPAYEFESWYKVHEFISKNKSYQWLIFSHFNIRTLTNESDQFLDELNSLVTKYCPDPEYYSYGWDKEEHEIN